MERNMMTRMLGAGGVFAPAFLGRGCSHAYAATEINNGTFQAAVKALDRFDLILTMESLFAARNQPGAAARCAISKVLGWNETNIPHANANSRSTEKKARSLEVTAVGRQCDPHTTDPPPPTEAEIEAVRAENIWDSKLHDEARRREAKLFKELGCQ
jgi:hypothetical protein